MKTEKRFDPMTDRYHFDFEECTSGAGWAQMDSRQDASYYGNWTNPYNLKILTYAEGDIYEHTCEDASEYQHEIRKMVQWHCEENRGGMKIDPGFSEEMKQRFIDLGMEDLLH